MLARSRREARRNREVAGSTSSQVHPDAHLLRKLLQPTRVGSASPYAALPFLTVFLILVVMVLVAFLTLAEPGVLIVSVVL